MHILLALMASGPLQIEHDRRTLPYTASCLSGLPAGHGGNGRAIDGTAPAQRLAVITRFGEYIAWCRFSLTAELIPHSGNRSS